MKKLLIILSLLVYSSLAGAPPVKRDAIILKSEGIEIINNKIVDFKKVLI